jgi:hypothetical protein
LARTGDAAQVNNRTAAIRKISGFFLRVHMQIPSLRKGRLRGSFPPADIWEMTENESAIQYLTTNASQYAMQMLYLKK